MAALLQFPSVMSLVTLPTVLLQCIMLWCDQTSKLRLARTCTLALRAASDPFPWSLSTALLCSLQPNLASFVQSLLRFSPRIHLRWLGRESSSYHRDIANVLSLSRVDELDAASSYTLTLTHVLTEPCFAQLESLSMIALRAQSGLRDALSALVRLHTVSLYLAESFEVLRALPLLPSLTDLSLDNGMRDPDASVLSECTGLHRLYLRGFQVDVLRCSHRSIPSCAN